MDVTDEMRQAVYAADCATFGHMLGFENVVSGTDMPNPNDPQGMQMPVLRARDASLMPHLTCQRCGKVWLVIDEPGRDYEDAVTKVAARLEPLGPTETAPLTPKPIPGVGDLPIPFKDGLMWDRLPPEHPARQWRDDRNTPGPGEIRPARSGPDGP